MKRFVVLLSLACALYLASAAVAAPKELCMVCVLRGETEPEDVVATRQFNEKTYSFCSEKCAQEFDQDPDAYVYELPRPAPSLELTTTGGEKVTLESLRGQWVVVDFWATWCKPCIKSMPELDAWSKTGDVRVVGVSIDTGKDREKKVRKFLEKNPVSYPIALDADESSAWERYKVKVLPTMLLINPEGTIVARQTGTVDLAALKRNMTPR